ncbi:MFS general substrate transporter [Hesseltinella vesiculosa]|uniref:MFS general substrate transporter n=1 Tax=Hesseltinella vesiculosa TaxID=101127 RepID=A0A1X2G9F9_9FUNG|nr:MFS general substrate transporter [Hesseltinella vesiculosa]
MRDQGKGVEDQQQPFIKTPAEKKLVTRMMLIVLPLVWLVQFVSFVDQAMLSVSAVNSLFTDINIDTIQYSWIAASINLGYLIYTFPNNLLMQRMPLARYLSLLLFLQGGIVVATAFANNFTQMLALRILLGIFESGISPVIILVLNTLFRRSEQGFVFGFTVFASGSGTVVGTLLGAEVMQRLDLKPFANLGTWHAWRWGYFMFGFVTIAISLLVLVAFPDTPYARIFRLSEDEKKIVRDRVADNMVTRTHEIKRSHIWEALKEFRFWSNALVNLLANMQNSGMVTFGVIIVESLGFSSLEATMLQIPSGAIAGVFALLASLAIRVTGQQMYSSLIFLLITTVGYVLLLTTETAAGQLFGYYLQWAILGLQVIQLNMVGNNVGGYTKKITYNSMFSLAGTIGSFIGPFLLVPPKYIGGYSAFIASNVVCVLLLLAMRWQMARENRKRFLLHAPPPPMDDTGFPPDLTDKENLSYIYKI